MDKHRAMLPVVAVLIADINVLIVVRYSVVVPLCPSSVSPAQRRITRKIPTLCHFLLFLLIVVIACPRLLDCQHPSYSLRPPYPPRRTCPERPPLLWFCRRVQWCCGVLLVRAVCVVLLSSQWSTLSLCVLECSLPPLLPHSHCVGGKGWRTVIVWEEKDEWYQKKSITKKGRRQRTLFCNKCWSMT